MQFACLQTSTIRTVLPSIFLLSTFLPSLEDTKSDIHSLFNTFLLIIFICGFIAEGICWVFNSHYSSMPTTACVIKARGRLTCMIYKHLYKGFQVIAESNPLPMPLPFHFSLPNGQNRLISWLTISHPPQTTGVNQDWKKAFRQSNLDFVTKS